MKIYLIGSLRNNRIPKVGNVLRNEKFDVFDDWFAPGPEADDKWRDYEKLRGRSYVEALAGHAAKHIFALDKSHLDQSDAAVLVAPAGKSAHLELGYMIGKGKPGYILFDGEPERWDVMTQFATAIFLSIEDLLGELVKLRGETYESLLGRAVPSKGRNQ